MKFFLAEIPVQVSTRTIKSSNFIGFEFPMFITRHGPTGEILSLVIFLFGAIWLAWH